MPYKAARFHGLVSKFDRSLRSDDEERVNSETVACEWICCLADGYHQSQRN